MLSYEDWREILKGERLPAAVVDLDAFDRNVAALAAMLSGGGKTLRLATKSLRVPALIERVLAHGAPYLGLMCFSCEEVELLAARGLDDFLVAYPTLQASDFKALRRVHDSGKRVMLVVDSEQGARSCAEAMRGAARPFPVVLDVDVSLRFLGLHIGVRRSPIRSMADVARMIDVVKAHSALKLVGAMAYEAQVAGLGDRNPFKRWMNPAARLVRAISVRRVARAREEIARIFADKGIEMEVFNGGGTGSVNYAVRERALTELAAGSALFNPHLFDYYSNVHFEPSCFFALQAVRQSDEGYVTCSGGGYIASGEPAWDRVPIPYLPRGATLVAMEGAGEVQTPVRLENAGQLTLGDPVLFRHAKAGELAERFNEYLLVSGGRITQRVPTYRGLQRCYF